MSGGPSPGELERLAPSPRAGFEGKIALITGASRGIGRALALTLAARGVVPIVGYRRNEEAANETVAEIERLGSTGLAIRADLESLEEIQAMFDHVQERFGRLDFFVSNASASNFRPLMELKPHHLERTFNTNVRAFVVGTQRAARLMDRGGRIVVLSSYGSLRVFPTYANLGATKAALEMWARYMAAELAPQGINVNAVTPGDHRVGLLVVLLRHRLGRAPGHGRAEDPQAAAGNRPGGRRQHPVPAVAGVGVHHRDDAGRRRRAGCDVAAV